MNSIIFTNLSENVVIRHGTHNSCKELNQTSVTREQPIPGIEVARMTGKERGKHLGEPDVGQILSHSFTHVISFTPQGVPLMPL